LKKLYEKIFSIKFFKMFLDIPVIGKLLSYEMLTYLFFGVMTTVVNLVVFFACDKILGNGSIIDFTLFSNNISVSTIFHSPFTINSPYFCLSFCLQFTTICTPFST